jgi:hypothetical protein
MAPLEGSRYVDLLFHYSPLDTNDWFNQVNPEHSVSPLGSVRDCHEATDSFGDGGEPFPTILCNEVETGQLVELPFLSPLSLSTPVTSGDELYDYWLSLNKQSEEEVKSEKIEREVHLLE